MQNLTIAAYWFYLPITIALTIWVARTLFSNGKVFLLQIFHGNVEMATAVNKLLLVGFYLINGGYILYTMTITHNLNDSQDVIEMLSKKIGLIILILGAMHFFNMYLLFRGKKKSNENAMRRELHEKTLL